MPETLTAEARAAQFAERVARRDDPPAPDPARFEPAQVLARLDAALPALTATRHARGRATLARMCHAFVAAPELTALALEQAAGVTSTTGSRARMGLERAGLLQHHYRGGHRYYRLTRFGEDWLLAVVQQTELPGPGVG